jgi:hypothetical protein
MIRNGRPFSDGIVSLLNTFYSDSSYAASIARFVTTVIVHIVCGHQITSDDDPYLKIAENTSNALTVTGSPGGTIIELLPFREFVGCWNYNDRTSFDTSIAVKYFPSWFPGAFYAGLARDQRPVIKELYEYPIADVKRLMARSHYSDTK